MADDLLRVNIGGSLVGSSSPARLGANTLTSGALPDWVWLIRPTFSGWLLVRLLYDESDVRDGVKKRVAVPEHERSPRPISIKRSRYCPDNCI